jgi:hypothetical protein
MAAGLQKKKCWQYSRDLTAHWQARAGLRINGLLILTEKGAPARRNPGKESGRASHFQHFAFEKNVSAGKRW